MPNNSHEFYRAAIVFVELMAIKVSDAHTAAVAVADGFADKLFGNGEHNPYLDDEYWEDEDTGEIE